MRYLAQGWRPAPRRVINVPQSTGLVILPPPPEPRRGIRL
jgi:hypothetical protein